MHMGRDIFFCLPLLAKVWYLPLLCFTYVIFMFVYLLPPDLLVLLSLISCYLSLVLRHKTFSQKPSHIKCFHKIFLLQNVFSKSYFVGLLESTSLQAGMLVEIRLPIPGSPQIPQKRGPYWEVLLF